MPAVLQGVPAEGVREARLSASDALAGFHEGRVGFAHGRNYRFADPTGATYTIPGEEAGEAIADGLRLLDDDYSPAPAPAAPSAPAAPVETEDQKNERLDAEARARLAAAGLAKPGGSGDIVDKWLSGQRIGGPTAPFAIGYGLATGDPETKGELVSRIHGAARAIPYLGPMAEKYAMEKLGGMTPDEAERRQRDLSRVFSGNAALGELAGWEVTGVSKALGALGGAVRTATGATRATEAIGAAASQGVKATAGQLAARAAREAPALVAEGAALALVESANEAALAKDGEHGKRFGEHLASSWWHGPVAALGVGGAAHGIGIAAERKIAGRVAAEQAAQAGAAPTPKAEGIIAGWFKRQKRALADMEAPSPHAAELDELAVKNPEKHEQLMQQILNPEATEAAAARDVGVVIDAQKAARDVARSKDAVKRRAEEFAGELEAAEAETADLALAGTNERKFAWRAERMPETGAGANAVDALDRFDVFAGEGMGAASHADQAVRGEVVRELDAIATARAQMLEKIPDVVRADAARDAEQAWHVAEGLAGRTVRALSEADPYFKQVYRERLGKIIEELPGVEQKRINAAVADAMTELRQRIDSLAKWDKDMAIPAAALKHMRGQPGLSTIRDIANDARSFLADPARWGQEVAHAQGVYNAAYSRFVGAQTAVRGKLAEKALVNETGGKLGMAVSEAKVGAVLRKVSSDADPLLVEKLSDYTRALADLSKASTLLGGDAAKAAQVGERIGRLGKTVGALSEDVALHTELKRALDLNRLNKSDLKKAINAAGIDPEAMQGTRSLGEKLIAIGEKFQRTGAAAEAAGKADTAMRAAGLQLVERGRAVLATAERVPQTFEYLNKMAAVDAAAKSVGIAQPKFQFAGGAAASAAVGAMSSGLGAATPLLRAFGSAIGRSGAGAAEKMMYAPGRIRAQAARRFAVEAATKRGEDASKILVLRGAAKPAKAVAPRAVESFAERGRAIIAKMPPSVRYTGSLVAQRALRDRFVGAVDTVREASANKVATMVKIVEGFGADLETSPKEAESAAVTYARAVDFLDAKVPVGFRRSASPFPMKEPIDAGVTPSQADRFLRYVQAVVDPMSVVEDAARGVVSREGVEALREVYPETFESLKQATLAEVEASDRPLSFNAQTQLSVLFDVPMRPSLDPQIVARIQGALMSDDQPEQDGGDAGMGPGRGETRQSSAGAVLAQTTATSSQRLAMGG